MRSRMRCLSSVGSGNPSSRRSQTTSSSTRTTRTPPVPGTSATSATSSWKVASSSCAIHAARAVHPHWVQYSIETLGSLGSGTGRSTATIVMVALTAVDFALRRGRMGSREGMGGTMRPLVGQTILITGATDGLGKALAVELAHTGATVLIHGRDDERGKAVVGEIERTTGNDRLCWYKADLD